MEKTPEPIKIAYCIQCHKYTPVLQELVDRLHGPNAKIYLHVDGKVSLDEFAPLTGYAHFVYPRIKVYWGTFSQIECMLRLLRFTQKSDCRYVVMLSGDTLPLHRQEKIHEALSYANQRCEEQVGCQSSLSIDEIRHKLRTNHYVPYRERRQKLWPIVRFIASFLLPANNRRFKKLPPIEKGCNWIAITDQFRDYALDRIDHDPDYVRAFRHSLCGDEIFFHTLMGDSPFAAANTRQSIMFTDWECDCPPRIFSDKDLQRLNDRTRNSGEGNYPQWLFARKFKDNLNLKAYREIVLDEPGEWTAGGGGYGRRYNRRYNRRAENGTAAGSDDRQALKSIFLYLLSTYSYLCPLKTVHQKTEHRKQYIYHAGISIKAAADFQTRGVDLQRNQPVRQPHSRTARQGGGVAGHRGHMLFQG